MFISPQTAWAGLVCYMRSESEKELCQRIIQLVYLLRDATRGMVEPMVFTVTRQYGRDPYLVLISCLLSLRTKDTITLPAVRRLFSRGRSVDQLLSLPIKTIEQLIYPVGFYRRKAHQIHQVSQDIVARFNGVVPCTERELLSIKGVGRKTVNLVLGEGFGIPAICVDTHVHRISNRLGLVATRTPEQTEIALMRIIPKKYWVEYNRLLVVWGQNVCVPISPRCSICPIEHLCKRVGVASSR